MGFGLRINFVDVVCDNSLKHTYVNGNKSGYQFDIRLSYYRGMFLSCIDRFEVFVDGEKVAEQDITFSINKKVFSAFQIPYCVTEFWQLTEPARIIINKPGGLTDGEHHINVVLMLRSPYMPLPGADGERKYMPVNCCGEKMLEIKEIFAGEVI